MSLMESHWRGTGQDLRLPASWSRLAEVLPSRQSHVCHETDAALSIKLSISASMYGSFLSLLRSFLSSTVSGLELDRPSGLAWPHCRIAGSPSSRRSSCLFWVLRRGAAPPWRGIAPFPLRATPQNEGATRSSPVLKLSTDVCNLIFSWASFSFKRLAALCSGRGLSVHFGSGNSSLNGAAAGSLHKLRTVLLGRNMNRALWMKVQRRGLARQRLLLLLIILFRLLCVFGLCVSSLSFAAAGAFAQDIEREPPFKLNGGSCSMS